VNCEGSNGLSIPEDGERSLFPFGLSVFFPAFNDARALPDLLKRTFAVLRSHVRDYEVIVVNDGSSDDTAAVLEGLRQKYAPHLRVVTHPENRGYGAALRTGFANAEKEFVFYTDGDGQYDPSELIFLLDAVTEETVLVNGYKKERHDPWHRVAIGWLYNQFARRLFRIGIRDIDCDFRLIRRSALAGTELLSTSGTICVELVRRLEMSGAKVVEVPVHHYPRLHGTSQFFRLRSLLTTFVQLCVLYWRLVLSSPSGKGKRAALPPGGIGLICAVIAALSYLAYARALTLPFMSDDYVQIQLARDYGPSSGWPALMKDVLYRCRATSLILTYWTEQAFGADPFMFRLTSLVLHVLNSFLVFAMGAWRPIGWRVSAVAAGYFAVSQRHQEAVIWYAALPELLVFFFAVASFLCWVRWLQSDLKSHGAYWGAFALFVAALFSKESAVVVPPLLLLALMFHRPASVPSGPIQNGGADALIRTRPSGRALARRDTRFIGVLPFIVTAAAYFGLIVTARQTHVHFNDAGTFSLTAPFVFVLLRSTAGLLWVWGYLAIICLLVWGGRKWTQLLSIAAVWSTVAFLPYCFLTYMPYVPSRHTYLAGAGLAFVIAAALLTLHGRTSVKYGITAVAMVAGLIVAHQCVYLWTKKQRQFEVRAWPTEELLRISRKAESQIYVTCFPYDRSVAELALRISSRDSGPATLVFDATAGSGLKGVNLCAVPAHE
jgi:glycosyltransferase involved in cell wall biosynthesis